MALISHATVITEARKTGGVIPQGWKCITLKGGVVVTMDSARRVIRDGVVRFEDDAIVFVGKAENAKVLEKVVDARGCFIMPGLVCAHTHLYGIALKGAALNIKPSTDFLQNL